MFRLLTLAAGASMIAASPAAAQRVTVSTGVDYSSGDYGTDTDTSILVIPFSLRASKDRWTLGASMPFISIDGSDSVVGGAGGPIVGGGNDTSSSRSGLGDLSLRGGYEIFDRNGAEFSVGGKIKLPTGSEEDNLSTGETDFSLGGEFALTRGDVTPFLEFGYRWLGDPEGRNLRNGSYGTLGASVILPSDMVGIVSYDYSAASTGGIDDSHSLFGGLVTRLNRRLSLTGYGTVGLSEGAPDYGVGVLLSIRAKD